MSGPTDDDSWEKAPDSGGMPTARIAGAAAAEERPMENSASNPNLPHAPGSVSAGPNGLIPAAAASHASNASFDVLHASISEAESVGLESLDSLGDSDESQRIEHSLHGLFRADVVKPRETTNAAVREPLDPVLPPDIFVLPASSYSPHAVLTAALPVTPESRPKPLASQHASRSKRKHRTSREKSRSQTSASPIETDLPGVGAIIDKYRIEELLGTGGFAAVFRATHLLLHMPVALKLLRSKVVRKNPELADKLCEEARFAAKINHPNVVRVFDVTHTKNITYVVMEYIEGRTLSKTISSDGPLPAARLFKVAMDVAFGLKAGLAQGLIHRDIKPANIMLPTDGSTKIVDLGLATPTTIDPSALDRARRTVVGTRGYMAPEAVSTPEKVDFRADIYGLGVSLLHAAVGKPPFSTDRDRTSARKARYEPILFPSSPLTAYPPQFTELLRWMLDEDVTRRPASYDLLLERLRELQNMLS